MAVSAGAFAAPGGGDADVVSVQISLAGVDLQLKAGAKIALGRIHTAAHQICGEEPTDGLDSRVQYRACLNQVTDRAVAKLGSPTVTALNGPAHGSAKVVQTAAR